MNDNLKNRTVSNIGYNSFARAAAFVLSTLASVILARNLTAADYGIVGFAAIFIGFLGRFNDLGISSAVIQQKELDEGGLYTGFTIKFILGMAVFAISFLFSPLSRTFFDNPAVEGVIKILSLNFIISTFSFLPTCLLRRGLNYKKLFVPQVISAFVSALLSMALALSGFRYWSIVLANIGSSLASVIVLNIIQPTRIRFHLEKNALSAFIRFGGSLFLSGMIVFILFNADNFIIGTVNGSKMLGYYALAFNWGSVICGLLYDAIHDVLFPTFSRIQMDREKLMQSYLKILEYIAFVGILVNLVLMAVSRELLVLVLGHGSDKWLPALTAFRILCVYGIFRCLLEPVANVFMAIGRVNVLFLCNLLVGILEVGFLYPTAKYAGIEGVAVLVTGVYALQYVVYFPYLKRKCHLGFGDVFAPLKPAIVSAILTLIIVAFAQMFLGLSYFTLLLKILLVTVGYVVFYGIITKWRLLRETKSLFYNMVASKSNLT